MMLSKVDDSNLYLNRRHPEITKNISEKSLFTLKHFYIFIKLSLLSLPVNRKIKANLLSISKFYISLGWKLSRDFHLFSFPPSHRRHSSEHPNQALLPHGRLAIGLMLYQLFAVSYQLMAGGLWGLTVRELLSICPDGDGRWELWYWRDAAEVEADGTSEFPRSSPTWTNQVQTPRLRLLYLFEENAGEVTLFWTGFHRLPFSDTINHNSTRK